MAALTFISIVRASVHSRRLSTSLTIILMAFGVIIISMLLLGRTHMESIITRQSKGIDLVAGAKGSPLQIILCNVFHIDFPTGNIGLADAYELSKHRLIAGAIPLSLGDSYENHRIVGTTNDFLIHYLGEESIKFILNENEILVGNSAATKLGLMVGDKISSNHGLSEGGESHDHPLVVSAILPKTGSIVDQLLLTDLRTIWHMHHAHDHLEINDSTVQAFGISITRSTLENEQITSLLIKYRSPLAAIQLPRLINDRTNMQAASPAFEVARMMTIMEPITKAVTFLGGFVLVIAVLSLWISLVNSLKERQYELAVMRAIGASRAKLAALIIAEGILLAFVGCMVGLLITHTIFGFAGLFNQFSGLNAFVFLPEEAMLMVLCVLIGFFAALWPAYRVYKSELSDTLAKG